MKAGPPSEDARIDEIRALLRFPARDDVVGRHRAGVLLAAIKSEEAYGSRRLEQIADDLGVHRATLYRHARVAECWSEGELGEILARAAAARRR